MLSSFIRRLVPLLVLGGLTLSSCVVHEHDYGRRGPDRRNDHHRDNGRHRDYGYRH